MAWWPGVWPGVLVPWPCGARGAPAPPAPAPPRCPGPVGAWLGVRGGVWGACDVATHCDASQIRIHTFSQFEFFIPTPAVSQDGVFRGLLSSSAFSSPLLAADLPTHCPLCDAEAHSAQDAVRPRHSSAPPTAAMCTSRTRQRRHKKSPPILASCGTLTPTTSSVCSASRAGMTRRLGSMWCARRVRKDSIKNVTPQCPSSQTCSGPMIGSVHGAVVQTPTCATSVTRDGRIP